MAQLVTFSEFSRIKGVTRAAIGNAVRRGSIPCIERDGKRWIDLDQIDEWGVVAGARKEKAPAPPIQEPKHPKSTPKPPPIRAAIPKPQPKPKQATKPKPAPKAKPTVSAKKKPEPAPIIKTAPTPQQTASYDFLEARAKKESFEADLAEMKANKEAGNLLERDGVVKAVANAAASLRMSLELLPSKLASLLAAERDPGRCRQLLAEQVDQALLDAVESLREIAP